MRNPGKWNWRKPARRKRIRTACAGALKKFPPPSEPKASEPKASEPKASEPKASEPKASEPKASEPKSDEPVSHETENVADLGLERAKRQPKPNPRRGKINHLDIGDILLEGWRQSNQGVVFTEGQGCWRYFDGLWRLQDDRSLRSWLDAQIEQCIRGTEATSQIRLVNETRALDHSPPGPANQRRSLRPARQGADAFRSGRPRDRRGGAAARRPVVHLADRGRIRSRRRLSVVAGNAG